MPYLADTNIAARFLARNDPLYALIQQAVFRLRARGEIVHITPQNMVEYRALATRPIEANGFGFTPAQATAEIRAIEAVFPMLEDTPAIYPLWRTLAETYEIVGRQVFDARLVAVMLAHGMTHLLTLNPTHFRRFMGEGITVVEPHEVQEEAPEEESEEEPPSE